MKSLALPGILVSVALFAGVGSAAGTATPANKRPPTIHGAAREGNVLDAHHGRWDDSNLLFTYQWRRCLPNGSACADIQGATDVIYAPRLEDVGRSLRVVVGATNRERRTGVAASAQTPTVVPLPAQAPHVATPPAIIGGASALLANPGTWTGTAPIDVSYRWRRCLPNGGSCDDTSVQSQPYRLSSADANRRLRVLVTAANAAGTSVALSDPSPLVVRPVASAKPQSSSLPTISGSPQQGQTLRGAPGVWLNKPSSFAYAWLRCDRTGSSCAGIGGARRGTYQLGPTDVGHTLRLQVEARNQGGAAVAVSAPTALVAAPPRAKASRPSNTSPPKITGTAQEGKTLAGDRGTWSNSPTSYEYTWRRCDSTGHNCDSIGGAHGTTYVVGSADVAHTLRLRVAARNNDGKDEATSSPTAVVRAAAAPASTSAPTVSGTPQEGRPLAGSRGGWTHTPTAFAYAWLRCNRNGAHCAAIPRAAAATYTPVSADVGNTLVFRVTASNSEGAATALSDPTAVIQRATTTPSRGPGCPAGGNPDQVANIKAPARLQLDGISSSPNPVLRSTTTLVIRFHVTSTCGGSVQGALVYATATPFNQFTIPAEAATGPDGWATLTFERLTGFPTSSRQQLLALFARARKPGDAQFGGIAARRLFSLHVRAR